MRKPWLVYILLFIIVLLFMLLLTKSCCNCVRQATVSQAEVPHIPVDMSQVVIWRNPDSSEASFRQYIDEYFPDSINNKRSYCSTCDSNLLMISGPDVVLYLQGQTAGGGSSTKGTGNPVGGDGPVLYSLNFPIEFGDTVTLRDSTSLGRIIIDSGSGNQNPAQTSFNPKSGFRTRRNGIARAAGNSSNDWLPIPAPGAFSENDAEDTVTVAVFDTGLDSALFAPYLYKNDISACLGPIANNGWNFINSIPDWNDDYTPPHGTLTSRFIIDQALQYNKNFVRILPVKIFGYNGQSHLYDVLCGLSYAKDRGANIINASFGFYAQKESLDNAHPDSAVLLFQKFLEKYLNEPGHVMLMLAAAGNKDDIHESYVYHSNNPEAMRNLDSVSFYPASFARDIPNIIAVTTVGEGINKVSPHQNFSPHVVDLGVNADYTVGDTAFLFKDPLAKNRPGQISTVEGSSFATPIAAGKIAANYFLISSLISAGPLQPASKEAILNALGADGKLHVGDNVFGGKIKGKRIVTK